MAIVTPNNCKHYKAENFKENMNKTCEIKGRCTLISDNATCGKFEEFFAQAGRE